MDASSLFPLEIIGVIAFAICGAMVGIQKKMDIFGVVVLGMTNAMGGGIIRDIIIGAMPPVAFSKPVYLAVATAVSLIVFIPGVRRRIHTDQWMITFMDSIGLGAFAVVGAEAGAFSGNRFLMVFLGTVTCVGGGVLRDLFAGEIPMIFVKHFYAIPAIIGTVLYVFLRPVQESAAVIATVAVILALRILAAKYKWNLPRA